jgi:ABC-type transport system involved in multi-copper enzyme maturation permease subunit
MKIRAIALNTFGSFLRNRLILLFCAIFLCVVLLFSTPILSARAMSSTMSSAQMQGMILSMVSTIMSLVSGFGSLLAAWAAADAVASEVRSGTILAVMARPVRRWEFLLGKYLGVMMLMGVYVLFLLASTYFFGWLGGEKIQASVWVMIVYPMVRYALYSAIAMFLVTAMHPIVAFGIVVVLSVVTSMVTPSEPSFLPVWLRTAIYAVLPSTGLLSEEQFVSMTQSSLQKTPWTDHLIALAYGLDYALVFVVLAAWLFRRRSLARE